MSLVSLLQLLLFKRNATAMDSQKEGQILFTIASGNYSRDLLLAHATVLFFSVPVNPTSFLVNMEISAIFPCILTSHPHYIGPVLRSASCCSWQGSHSTQKWLMLVMSFFQSEYKATSLKYIPTCKLLLAYWIKAQMLLALIWTEYSFERTPILIGFSLFQKDQYPPNHKAYWKAYGER